MRHHEVPELAFGQESASDSAPAVAEHPAPSRVLLVEDDPGFSDFLAWAFTQHGYAVEKATNTREALSLLNTRGESQPFDLVLSDVAMPGGPGTDLLFAPAVVERGPPLILMSAFGTRELQAFVEDSGGEFLHKPFKLDSLFQCVLDQLRARFLAMPASQLASPRGLS